MLRKFRRGLRRGWQLGRNPHRTILILRLAIWTIALVLLTKVCTLPRALRFITRSPQPSRHAPPPQELVALVDRLLSLNRWVFTPTCWKRAILLHRSLAQQGIATQVVFGVRQGEGQLLDGHAWLEAHGQPLYEATPPNYAKTLILP